MLFCPNCRQPVPDGNAFCPFCGVSVPADAAIPFVPPTGLRKKCANGHSFDDMDLTYCPECGLELTVSSDAETWVCPHCGCENTGSAEFCISCGKNRHTPVRRSAPPVVPEGRSDTLPRGLRPATPGDLLHK